MKPVLYLLAILFLLGQSASAFAQDPKALEKGDNAKQTEVVVSPQDQAKAEELFQAGRTLFFQGEYQLAIEKLSEAVSVDSTKTGYQMLLAKSYRYSKQNDKALAVLEQILKANPDHVDAGLDLAELLTPDKQPDRVIAVLKPLLKFNSDYPINHLLAEAHYQKEEFETARNFFEQATKLNPRNSNDHYQLGNIYLAQKHFAKAALAYEEAGRLGLSSGIYHFKLASVYFNLHNYLGKISSAEVIGGKVGDIKNFMYLADEVPGKNDKFYVASPKSAIFQTVKAQNLGIEIFDIQFLEANIWLSARRYARAEGIYTKLEQEVKPADLGLFYYYWAQTALGMQDYSSYLTRLNKAIEAEPDVYKSTLADAYVTVANGYHQRGLSEQYIEYLQRAVKTNPLSARLHLLLGDAFWLAGNSQLAIKQYRLILELEPDHPHRVRLLNRIRGQENIAG